MKLLNWVKQTFVGNPRQLETVTAALSAVAAELREAHARADSIANDKARTINAATTHLEEVLSENRKLRKKVADLETSNRLLAARHADYAPPPFAQQIAKTTSTKQVETESARDHVEKLRAQLKKELSQRVTIISSPSTYFPNKFYAYVPGIYLSGIKLGSFKFTPKDIATETLRTELMGRMLRHFVREKSNAEERVRILQQRAAYTDGVKISPSTNGAVGGFNSVTSGSFAVGRSRASEGK